jgi:hypothetical protein
MHEFAHLFDVILSIYFVPFARIIIFGFIFVIIRKLLVGKSTSAKIFHQLQHTDIFASDLKGRYIFF